METIEPVAHSISTYGLYAIIAILCFVVVYLYKRVGDLEKEIRNLLASKAADAAEMAKANAQMIEVLKDNTAAFNNFQTTLSEIKTTIQMSMDRKP